MPSFLATSKVSSVLASSTRMMSSTTSVGMSLNVAASVRPALYAGSTTQIFWLAIMRKFSTDLSACPASLEARVLLHGCAGSGLQLGSGSLAGTTKIAHAAGSEFNAFGGRLAVAHKL